MAEDFTGQILNRMLDLSTQRFSVLRNNVANVNTPGYKRQDIEFEAELADAVKDGPKAVQKLVAQVLTDEKTAGRIDGNNVQLEYELAELGKSKMLYDMAIQIVSMRMQMQRMAVTGRTV